MFDPILKGNENSLAHYVQAIKHHTPSHEDIDYWGLGVLGAASNRSVSVARS